MAVGVDDDEELFGEYDSYTDKFILCTGGMSYKNTGSSGECYKILKKYSVSKN